MPNEWGTAGYVPGLKIKVTSVELSQHMRDRAVYHESRRDEKRRLLPQIEDAAQQLKSQAPAQTIAQFNKSGVTSNPYRFDGDDAVEQLKADIENHNNKAVAFKFLAEHLFAEDYCLDRSDLVGLEILKN